MYNLYNPQTKHSNCQYNETKNPFNNKDEQNLSYLSSLFHSNLRHVLPFFIFSYNISRIKINMDFAILLIISDFWLVLDLISHTIWCIFIFKAQNCNWFVAFDNMSSILSCCKNTVLQSNVKICAVHFFYFQRTR